MSSWSLAFVTGFVLGGRSDVVLSNKASCIEDIVLESVFGLIPAFLIGVRFYPALRVGWYPFL